MGAKNALDLQRRTLIDSSMGTDEAILGKNLNIFTVSFYMKCCIGDY